MKFFDVESLNISIKFEQILKLASEIHAFSIEERKSFLFEANCNSKKSKENK